MSETRIPYPEAGAQVYDAVKDGLQAVIGVDLKTLYDAAPTVIAGGHAMSLTEYAPQFYAGGSVRETSLVAEDSVWPEVFCFRKDETEQSVGAYKVRGAKAAVDEVLTANPQIRHVVIASAGNAGAGTSEVVRAHNEGLPEGYQVQAHVFCIGGVSKAKKRLNERLGAEVHLVDEAGTPHSSLEHAQQSAKVFTDKHKDTAVQIEPFNHPTVMAGQATVLLEAMAQLWSQGIDTRTMVMRYYVAGGGFGLANGSGVVMDTLIEAGLVMPGSEVVAGQVENNDAQSRALAFEEPTTEDLKALFLDAEGCDVFDGSVDGTAVRIPGDKSLALTRFLEAKGVLRRVGVSHGHVGRAMRQARMQRTKPIMLEPAGALGKASMDVDEQRRAARRLVDTDTVPELLIYVASGRNVTEETVAAFDEYAETFSSSRTVVACGAVAFLR